ncbi:MAG: condensation domain-containing protein, partial [Actinoallomurus sp.]
PDRDLVALRPDLLPDTPAITWGPDGDDLEERFAGAVARGDVDPATCVLLDTDAEVCARIEARFPDVLAVPVPDSADEARHVLDHIWALDPPPGRGGTTHPDVCRRILAGLTDPRTIHDAAGRERPRGSRGAHVAPRDERERVIADILTRLLGAERVGMTDGFFELGGDSMTAIQVVSQAARHGIELTPRQVLEAESIADLALDQRSPIANAEQGAVVGPVTLTAAQRWFFDQPARGMADPDHFNHPYYLNVEPGVAPEHLEQALRHLVGHHDALRLRFARDDAGDWSQWAEPPGVEVPFDHVDLTTVPHDEREATAEREAAAAQRGLDLGAGPLVRALHMRLGDDEPDRLLIVNHHLAVDAISRGVLLEDLSTLCVQAARGEPMRLPAKTTSYQDWAARLQAYADSGELLAETPFWLDQLADGTDGTVPVDHADGVFTYDSASAVAAELDQEHTGVLQRLAGRELRSGLADLLLGVTGAVLADWMGESRCRVAVAGHGRQDVVPDVDLSRTVGWFQIYYPLALSIPAEDDWDTLRSVRGQLDQVPHNGIGHSVLRYLSSDEQARRRFAEGRQPQVSFNYMGDFGFDDTSAHTSLFGACPRSYGLAQDDKGVWPYLLDVVPSIVGRRLRVEINYSRNVHTRQTAETIARQIVHRLRELAR